MLTLFFVSEISVRFFSLKKNSFKKISGFHSKSLFNFQGASAVSQSLLRNSSVILPQVSRNVKRFMTIFLKFFQKFLVTGFWGFFQLSIKALTPPSRLRRASPKVEAICALNFYLRKKIPAVCSHTAENFRCTKSSRRAG